MITNKPKNKSIKIVVIIILILATLSIVSILASDIFGYSSIILNKKTNITTNSNNSDSINYGAPTNEQKQAGDDIKKQNDQPTTNNDLGVLITSIVTNGDNIRVRNTISGTITNNGTCTISINNSSNSKSYEATAQTFAMTSYSTCQGFDIPKSELGTGEWQIKLSVTIDGKTSTSSSNYKVE